MGAAVGAAVTVGRAVGAAVAGGVVAGGAVVGLPAWHFTSWTTAPLALTIRAKSVASLSLNTKSVDHTYDP
jgi:hypothetical protein